MLTSCDKVINEDFYVINKCDKQINITITDNKKEVLYRSVSAEQELLVYSSEGLKSLMYEKIESVFSLFIITLGNDTATSDFIDKGRWELKEISDNQVNYYLSIDSTDFK